MTLTGALMAPCAAQTPPAMAESDRPAELDTPAGGSYSTVDELLAFANALTSHKLLSAATTDSLLAPRLAAPMGGDYAYGFLVGRRRSGEFSFGHAGGFPGVSTSLRAWPQSGWTLIVLSNISGGADEVVELWRGLKARIR